jgi:predicted TIM-barrel fold metal-dependent hydrolase
MLEKDGKTYFILDSHVALWDGSPANQANRFGEGFINCFYDFHRNLSPGEWVWSKDKFQKYPGEVLTDELFGTGDVDLAVLQTVNLSDFYVNGFSTVERHAALAAANPGKYIVNGSFDPRLGEPGLARLEREIDEHSLTGIKLYTASWLGDSKGYKLSDPWSYRYLEKCQELGVRNIHVHKGPTVYPLNRDSFDVADVDDAATEFPGLRFIVEHVGMPRVEDFCWIAIQEPNVYGGLSVLMPFLYARPHYFGQVLAELLFFLGEDRLTFGSDFPLWHPKWLIEKFLDFQLPEDVRAEYGMTLTEQTKRKILGLNAARLYDIEVPAECRLPEEGPDQAAVTSEPTGTPA